MGFLRVVTALVGLGMVSLASLGIGLLYLQLQQVCVAPLAACAPTMQLMPSNLVGVADPAAALQFHASWRAGLNAVGRGVYWLLALLILRYRSRDFMGLITALWLLTYGAPFDLFAVAAAYPFLLAPIRVLLGLNTLCFGLFLTLFPRGQFQPRWSLAVAALWVLAALLNLFPAVSPLLTSAAQYRELVINAVLYGSTAWLQLYRYRQLSSSTERQQTKWVVLGILVWWGGSLLTRWLVAALFVSTAPVTPLYYLAGIGFPIVGLVLPVAVGLAILRHRLFDIDLLINRTLVYGALTAFVVGTYTLVVGAVGALLRVEEHGVLSLSATGLVAVAFNPVRERLQRAVNRLLYGERDDPYAVLARFGQRLEMTLAAHAILPTIVETIAQTLKLPYAALRLNTEPPITHGTLPAHTQPTAFPLVYQSAIIGQLEVAPRAADEAFTPAERRLLTALAQQAGVAAHTVRLTADLQQARARLVTTREEERRRLRRDLHDGLGPKLAGQALILEAVRDALAPDAPSRALVNHLIADSQSVVAEIRELVQGLRPPALDEFGLVGAVRALAAQCEPGALRVTVTVLAVLPSLPAAVEVAVYRIAQEALTNVVKHARATDCQVQLDLADATLCLTVQDNGLGLPMMRRPGVGLNSMRERAEEIGGRWVVATSRAGGTTVAAHFPIPQPP